LPEEDESRTFKYLGEDLAAAAAKVPAGVLSATNLKAMFKEAMAEGEPRLANTKSGIFPSHPPVPMASGLLLLLLACLLLLLLCDVRFTLSLP
jgi:hypothetical protein